MDDAVKNYLRVIGRRRERRSRRGLTSQEAREMGRVREARRLFRRFHGTCFWNAPEDLLIGRGDVEWVAAKLRDERLAPFPRTPYAVRKHRTADNAISTHLDAQIGRILDALEATDKADETVIIFTADHGPVLQRQRNSLAALQTEMPAPLVSTH